MVGLAVLCGLATFAILTGLTPIVPSPRLVQSLLITNGLLVSFMGVMIGRQVWELVDASRRGIAGAGLHIRIVSLLGLFAAVPAIIVAVFATVTLNRGLDTWFSERTQSIVGSAITVARAYIQEQVDVARSDVGFIAQDLSEQRKLFNEDRQAFIRRLAAHAAFRALSGAFVIDDSRYRIEASATANETVTFRPPDESHIERAKKGEVVLIDPGDGNVIRALIKLKNFDNQFLYVYRLVNPVVVRQLIKARAEKAEYDRLLSQRTVLQLNFALMYAGVAFVFLLASVWLGMRFADRLVEPVVQLVDGARRVSRGDLDAKVPVSAGTGDLVTLGQTFNQMTGQLQVQRDELVLTNHKLDERRRFTEAVLLGISAGVIGLDSDGVITLANRSASKLLGMRRNALTGKPLADAIAVMQPLFEKVRGRASGSAEGQVSIRVDGQERSFVVRVTTEKSEDEHGYVVTFDDITELVSAQRNSAWADIARRIAHEIKNPLTPIQLSAERLKRKYGKEITSDPKVFEQCTETIIRQVGDIGRMVDEFSSFARMPSAVLEPNDFSVIVREALVLQRASFEEIKFEIETPEKPVIFPFDRRLVTQAITNLVKNASEAIEARVQKTPEPPARIKIAVSADDAKAVVEVTDNGIGLPKENRNRLTEPYMTTRTKGTGLGLAIVTRIMEDHSGALALRDAPSGFDGGIGACIRLTFPRDLAIGPNREASQGQSNPNKSDT